MQSLISSSLTCLLCVVSRVRRIVFALVEGVLLPSKSVRLTLGSADLVLTCLVTLSRGRASYPLFVQVTFFLMRGSERWWKQYKRLCSLTCH